MRHAVHVTHQILKGQRGGGVVVVVAVVVRRVRPSAADKICHAIPALGELLHDEI
jgi:hypothetical protein